ncbi:MAG TPA: Holliday junction branch migration protein RuvA, partial [Candidatus Avipropionibacterium avicola]|nr:Holliday junction branch migration protein RuvA [Candidatus Avipropionibacterium avicola]
QVGPRTSAALRLGATATLSTSLVVREESLTLYGFDDDAARDLFELLLTANGVGPKLAQAALAVHEPDVLRSAIANGEHTVLTAVPGIGRKGAEKICLELRDKVQRLGAISAPTAGEQTTPDEMWRGQVSEGLQGLGWSAKDAVGACDRVAPLVEEDPQISIAALMRAALQSLAR